MQVQAWWGGYSCILLSVQAVADMALPVRDLLLFYWLLSPEAIAMIHPLGMNVAYSLCNQNIIWPHGYSMSPTQSPPAEILAKEIKCPDIVFILVVSTANLPLATRCWCAIPGPTEQETTRLSLLWDFNTLSWYCTGLTAATRPYWIKAVTAFHFPSPTSREATATSAWCCSTLRTGQRDRPQDRAAAVRLLDSALFTAWTDASCRGTSLAMLAGCHQGLLAPLL